MENANINDDSLRTKRDSESQHQEIPEEEKSGVINENENKQLMGQMDERVESLPPEMEYWEEAKELVKALRARIAFLENEVINRLQRQLGSVSAEAEIAEAEAKAAKEELRQMKTAFREMEQRSGGREWGFKEEKAALLERLERLTMENQHLWKEARDAIFEREREIMTLKRDLEESRAKNLEKEKKILELERGILMKFPWPAAASAGTVVAAAMIFLSCSKQKRQ
ncbi:hypothetical protein ACLOJK_010974 [Asimina triloba]